jgi:hypothetical protein
MIRIPFRDVMEGVLAHCGQKFDATLADQQSIMINFINLRVQEAWYYGAWREIALCEERAFADTWNASQAYVIGDIVYRSITGKYYAALTDNQDKTPETNTSDWAVNATHDYEIADEQYGAEKIGRVWGITGQNPRKVKNVRSYDFVQSNAATHVLECSLNTVWIHFSNPAPRFAGKAWSASPTTPYSRGTVIFYPGTETGNFPNAGECYRADRDVDGNAIWVLVPFPEVLSRFVVAAAGADMQRYYGKSEEAAELKDEAYTALYNEARRNGIGAEIKFSGR